MKNGFASRDVSATNSARSSFMGPNLQNLSNSRKDISITPAIKMKQLQWDKLPQPLVGKTLWSAETPDRERKWVNMLQTDGIWKEMEEDFKAKQLVVNLMGACIPNR
jgi:cytokinesis protein